MKGLGMLLVVLGLVGLIYGGFSWTKQDKVIDAGPIQVTKDETKRLPISPIAGGVILVAGVAILLKQRGA